HLDILPGKGRKLWCGYLFQFYLSRQFKNSIFIPDRCTVIFISFNNYRCWFFDPCLFCILHASRKQRTFCPLFFLPESFCILYVAACNGWQLCYSFYWLGRRWSLFLPAYRVLV